MNPEKWALLDKRDGNLEMGRRERCEVVRHGDPTSPR